MSDDRNFLERLQGISQNWTGESMSEDDVVNEFKLYSHSRRAQALDEIDSQFESADTSDLKKYSEFCDMRRRLKSTHHALRKAGR